MTLELGGKSANVIFADADLERAAAAAPMAVFGNAGQDCCARSRILVQRSVVERFMELLEPHVQAIAVGDPLSNDTQMGPLISAGQRETVASFVPEDAPVAFQGSAPNGPGFWFAPTVLFPVGRDDRAVTEEIFGPVAVVIPFEDEAEAIEIANDTIYGLSGSIWTRERRAGAARRPRAGDRRAVDQREHLGAGGDAVRRLQAVRRRARARAACARRVLRAQVDLLRDGGVMSGRLEGKVCVITGAAGGIGAAACELFAEEGATVVGVDLLDVARVDLALAADVADEAQVAAMYARCARRTGASTCCSTTPASRRPTTARSSTPSSTCGSAYRR